MVRSIGAIVLGMGALSVLASAGPALAHPHVLIKVETEVVTQGGSITGFRHSWTFEPSYLASIREEFDADGNGSVDAGELDKLLANTRETLDRFGAFTVVWQGKRRVDLKQATDIAMSFDGGIPVLGFAVDLTRPLPLAAPGVRFEVYDATYFSGLNWAGAAAVRFAGMAPAGCALRIEPAAKGPQLSAYRAFAREFGPQSASLITPTVVVADCGKQNAAGKSGSRASVLQTAH